MKVKEESEKADLKLNIQKTKKRHLVPSSGPICSHPTSWQIDGETMDMVTLFSWAQKSLWVGTVAIKIKRCLLLGRKAMKT